MVGVRVGDNMSIYELTEKAILKGMWNDNMMKIIQSFICSMSYNSIYELKIKAF